MADVGALAGVTDRTVSNVLSGKVPVRPTTRDAVLKAVRDLGYRMNTSARSLRTGRTGTITLAVPDLGYDYYSQFAHVVMHEAEAVGWAVTIVQTGTDPDREASILAGTGLQQNDGLIFHAGALETGPGLIALRDYEHLALSQPVVLLGDRITDAPVDHVAIDNTPAARAATQHLLDLGRRRIAIIGPDPRQVVPDSSTLRLAGYREALTGAGLAWPEELVRPTREWRREDGQAAVTRLLADGVHFDALFCCNDDLACGALHALHEHGVAVPDDVAVVGFDDVRAAAFAHPPLTTIDAGGPRIARTAVEMLSTRVGRTYTELPPRKVVVDFSLVRRRSA